MSLATPQRRNAATHIECAAALVFVLALIVPSARAMPQFQWDEYTASSLSDNSLGTFPVDCATSHNNNRAAVARTRARTPGHRDLEPRRPG